MGEKQAVLKLLEQLPEEATLEEIQYHLYVLQKIRAGQEAADRGHVIPHEAVMRELAGWLGSMDTSRTDLARSAASQVSLP